MGTQQAADLAIGTTAAEAAILAATQAAIDAGKDPFGDDDTDDDNSAATAQLSANDDADDADTDAEADDATDTDADAADDTDKDEADETLTPEQLAAVAEDDAAPAVAEAQRFKVQTPAEFAAARKELLDKRAKAFKEYADGVIEPEEYSRIDSEVFDALEALTVQRTLHEANTQREASTQEQVLDSIMVAAKAQGVDYTADAQAARRFDAEMALLAADGVKRTYAQAAALAHQNVLAVRGIKADTKAPAEPAKPRANGKPPLTLRNVPPAAVPNGGGDWTDSLNKLTGTAYEEAFSRLTPAQQAQLRGD